MIFDTRLLLAQTFGIEDPGQIAFTANATQSLNIAVHGLFKKATMWVSTVCEHNSVLRPFVSEAGGGRGDNPGANHRTAEGILIIMLEAAVKTNTRAIVITHASNPREISPICGESAPLRKSMEFSGGRCVPDCGSGAHRCRAWN